MNINFKNENKICHLFALFVFRYRQCPANLLSRHSLAGKKTCGVKNEFSKLLAGNYIDEWIAVHLNYNDRQRGGLISGHLKEFVSRQTN